MALCFCLPLSCLIFICQKNAIMMIDFRVAINRQAHDVSITSEQSSM